MGLTSATSENRGALFRRLRFDVSFHPQDVQSFLWNRLIRKTGFLFELGHDTLYRHSVRRGVEALVFRKVGGLVEHVSKASD